MRLMRLIGPISPIGPIRKCGTSIEFRFTLTEAKRQTPNSIHNMEPGGAKRLDGLRQLPVAHQDVIGIKCADW
jgi:hypothetical protein